MRQPAIFCLHLLQDHGERIGLLAGRRGRAPDAEAPLPGARRHQRRNDRVAEMIERDLVAEEERLVGRHRLDHVDDQRARWRPLSFCTSSPSDARPALRASGSQPAFDQILLVGRQHEAGALLQELAEIVVVERRHDLSPLNSRTIFGAICIERQHRRADARIRRGARHAPDDAGRLVLRDHAAAGSGDILRAVHSVRAHAGEDHGQDRAAPDLGCRGEQRVDGGPAEIDERPVVQRDRRCAVAPRDRHVAAAGREIDRAGRDRLAVDRLMAGAPARAREMLGENGREGRRHVLGDEDRRALEHRRELG